MKKQTRPTRKVIGIIIVALMFGGISWSAGWVSARIYFAKKIEKEPVVIQASPAESMFSLINKARRSEGLNGLYLDDRLIDAAYAKSCDMRDRGYFDHQDPQGNFGWHFINEQGIGWIYAGENISMGSTYPKVVEDSFMKSPEHRDNILDKRFTRVGYATCGEYTTQFFVK